MSILAGNRATWLSVILCAVSGPRAYQKNGLEEDDTGLQTFLVVVICEDTHGNMSGSQVEEIHIC